MAIALGLGALFFSSTSTSSATPGALDFSISIDMVGGNSNTCDSSGNPTAVCNVTAGQDFLVRVHLNQLPAGLPNGKYFAYDAYLAYSGVTSDGTQESIDVTPWPSCALPAKDIQPDHIVFDCTVFPSMDSSYTGVMATVRLHCTADGTITLNHAAGFTDLADRNSDYYNDPDGSESLTIHCVAPQAYPGDTDGDGCPDAREQVMNQMMGGRRNFLNPWDWWDPTGDHMTRIDDVLAVASHYGKNAGDPGYDAKYDRTYLGPNPWNLGPPDGMIRSVDINLIARQYGAGCSAS